MSLPSASISRARIFGVRVDAGSLETTAQALHDHAHSHAQPAGGVVCVANVDMVTRAVNDPRLKAVMEDALAVVSDGMPLVWRLRSLGHRHATRVCGPDLMFTLCRLAERDGRAVFFFGGTPQEIKQMSARLRERFPQLQIAGAVSPPLLPTSPGLDPAIIERINSTNAGIVFVGLGCPKQEFWMSVHAPHLKAVTIGVGYAFALAAGLQPQAPTWMQRSGLEWLFRLVQEPGRLWRRYFVSNSRYIWYSLLSVFGWRRG